MAGVAIGSGGLPSNASPIMARQTLRKSSTIASTSVDNDRQTIRCPHCSLNQFVTASRQCRRCHQSVDPEPVLPPPPLPALIPPAVCPVFHSIDLTLPPILLWMRLRCGLSQKQLANQSGINRTNISQMENGLRMPNVIVLKRLAGAMGTSAGKIMLAVEYLMDGR